MADANVNEIKRETQRILAPYIKVLLALLVLALVGALALVIYFVRLAGGIWGGS